MAWVSLLCKLPSDAVEGDLSLPCISPVCDVESDMEELIVCAEHPDNRNKEQSIIIKSLFMCESFLS